MTDPRQITIETLQTIIDKQIFFSEAKASPEISEHKDFSFINMLILTSLRRLCFIEKCIKKFAAKKLPDKHAFARWALVAASAEILFLDTPDYAVLNSYVNLVKKKNDKYIAGFINAVLRKIAAAKNELLKEDNGTFFPENFRKLLQKDYTNKQIRLIEEASVSEAPLDLSVKSDPQQWAEELGGILMPGNTIRLENGGKIAKLPGYASGDWWVQDFSASLAVKALKPQAGQRILDLCAAPGGKTAQLLNAGIETTALDISEPRLKTLAENLHRLNFSAARIICADALDYLQNFSETPFDSILLDAPCSATGTLRRHPELVHIKKNADIQKMSEIQKSLLDFAGNALKVNGELLYCVCSIAKEEGEKQITDFLHRHPEFVLTPLSPEDITASVDPGFANLFTSEGYIRTLPYHYSALGGTDSFFIAKLRKAS